MLLIIDISYVWPLRILSFFIVVINPVKTVPTDELCVIHAIWLESFLGQCASPREACCIQTAESPEFQRVHRLGKPNSTSSRPIIVRFLQFTDKEEVMSTARKELKDKVFSMYDSIPKDLYNLRKQHQKKFKQAWDKGYKAHFSKAHPDQLFVNGKFLPPDQPFE